MTCVVCGLAAWKLACLDGVLYCPICALDVLEVETITVPASDEVP